MELRLDTSTFGRISVVSVGGDVHEGNTASLRGFLIDVSLGDPSSIVVDLRDVPSVDASGLATLTAVRRHLERADIAMVLVVRDPAVLRAFRVSGLADTFTILPSLDAALQLGLPRTRTAAPPSRWRDWRAGRRPPPPKDRPEGGGAPGPAGAGGSAGDQPGSR